MQGGEWISIRMAGTKLEGWTQLQPRGEDTPHLSARYWAELFIPKAPKMAFWYLSQNYIYPKSTQNAILGAFGQTSVKSTKHRKEKFDILWGPVYHLGGPPLLYGCDGQCYKDCKKTVFGDIAATITETSFIFLLRSTFIQGVKPSFLGEKFLIHSLGNRLVIWEQNPSLGCKWLIFGAPWFLVPKFLTVGG